MGFADEVIKTINMLKSAGNSIADIVFEGALSVKKKEVLMKLQELEATGESIGVIRVGYLTPEKKLRVIEVPVGKETEQKAPPGGTG
jgi:hypothetical protein